MDWPRSPPPPSKLRFSNLQERAFSELLAIPVYCCLLSLSAMIPDIRENFLSPLTQATLHLALLSFRVFNLPKHLGGLTLIMVWEILMTVQKQDIDSIPCISPRRLLDWCMAQVPRNWIVSFLGTECGTGSPKRTGFTVVQKIRSYFPLLFCQFDKQNYCHVFFSILLVSGIISKMVMGICISYFIIFIFIYNRWLLLPG